MTDMLEAALRCSAAGWPVFPCRPNGKAPLYANPHPKGSPERRTCRATCGRDGHGVLDATVDPDRISRWWTRTRSANIGVACGAPGPDVVDFDCKNGAPGVATFGRLRDAGLLRGAHSHITTPSGGFHLYYAGTEQENGVRSQHGVDFRTRGGYVLAPPSVVDGHRYRLAEGRLPTGITVDWAAICSFLDPPRPPRPPFTPPAGADAHRHLVAWLEKRPAGDRNSALFWACMKAISGGTDDRAIDDLRDAIIRAGHNPNDAQKTADSARAGASK